jgi:hypothetical protein
MLDHLSGGEQGRGFVLLWASFEGGFGGIGGGLRGSFVYLVSVPIYLSSGANSRKV